MYTKPLFIILLLSTFTYATETNSTTDALKEKETIAEEISLELNSTIIDNNLSNEINISVIKIESIEKSLPIKKSFSKQKNFNMTKGDSKKGKNIFIKNLKKVCQSSSYKFSTSYSQDEWEEIAEAGRFREVVFKLCINIREVYQDNWSPDLYQFAYEHANDS